MVNTKILDVWKDFVHKRWNAEARFLNLEVRSHRDLRRCINALTYIPEYVGRRLGSQTQPNSARRARRLLQGSRHHFQDCLAAEARGLAFILLVERPQLNRFQVQTISLANNNIASGQLISTLGHYLPKLANLSLQNNAMKLRRDLDFISGRRGKLEHLRELILAGNPLRELEIQNGRADQYKRCVSVTIRVCVG